jgi:hypothetical protein
MTPSATCTPRQVLGGLRLRCPPQPGRAVRWRPRREPGRAGSTPRGDRRLRSASHASGSERDQLTLRIRSPRRGSARPGRPDVITTDVGFETSSPSVPSRCAPQPHCSPPKLRHRPTLTTRSNLRRRRLRACRGPGGRATHSPCRSALPLAARGPGLRRWLPHRCVRSAPGELGGPSQASAREAVQPARFVVGL